MRENRTYGSEGGAARAVPTPIMLSMPHLSSKLSMDPRFREDDEQEFPHFLR